MSPHTYWLARLIVCAWVLQLPLFGWLEPDSLVSRTLLDSGPMGPVSLKVLALLGSLGVADVALNDWSPSNRLPACLQQRHLGYMLTAIVLVVLSGVIYYQSRALTPLLTSFWLPALFCVLIVPLDLLERHAGPA